MTHSADGRKIQCHACGKFFGCLGTHINAAHGMNADEYCDEFALLRKTPLSSKSVCERMAAYGKAERQLNHLKRQWDDQAANGFQAARLSAQCRPRHLRCRGGQATIRRMSEMPEAERSAMMRNVAMARARPAAAKRKCTACGGPCAVARKTCSDKCRRLIRVETARRVGLALPREVHVRSGQKSAVMRAEKRASTA